MNDGDAGRHWTVGASSELTVDGGRRREPPPPPLAAICKPPRRHCSRRRPYRRPPDGAAAGTTGAAEQPIASDDWLPAQPEPAAAPAATVPGGGSPSLLLLVPQLSKLRRRNRRRRRCRPRDSSHQHQHHHHLPATESTPAKCQLLQLQHSDQQPIVGSPASVTCAISVASRTLRLLALLLAFVYVSMDSGRGPDGGQQHLHQTRSAAKVAPVLWAPSISVAAAHQSSSYRNTTESAELVTKFESSLSLMDILPIPQRQYDKNRAPKLLGQPTVVYFHVTVLSLDSINEESMTYVTDIFLAQSWRDPRLRLPENMSEEYRILDVDWLHSIWRPDCFFKNAKKVTFHEMSIPNHYLWLYHDKTLLYMSKLTLVLSCAMKFESYPHDTQICSMMIESLSHTVQDLVFIWNMTDPLVVNTEIELPQQDISSNYTTDCTIEYSTGNFTCLAVVFNLRRRLGYHLFHTYIPSALIVVMSWISFWIKPEAIPARVTLGVTSLLTLATQNTQSQQSLPPVSYVKAVDIWMSSCSVFVFLSLMEFAVVNNYMGPVATKVMKGYSDEDLSGTGDGKDQRTSMVPQYDTFCHGRETALFIDKFSRFFFPFSFCILNVVYWTTFL